MSANDWHLNIKAGIVKLRKHNQKTLKVTKIVEHTGLPSISVSF